MAQSKEVLKMVSRYSVDDQRSEQITKGYKYLEMAVKHLLGDKLAHGREIDEALHEITRGNSLLLVKVTNDDHLTLEFTPISSVSYLVLRTKVPHYEQDFR